MIIMAFETLNFLICFLFVSYLFFIICLLLFMIIMAFDTLNFLICFFLFMFCYFSSEGFSLKTDIHPGQKMSSSLGINKAKIFSSVVYQAAITVAIVGVLGIAKVVNH